MDINLSCRINNTSLGYYGFNILKSLNELGYEVTYWPIEDPDRISFDKKYTELLQKAISQQGKYNVGAPSVRYSHPNDLAQHVGKGPRIGNTIFELDNFRSDEIHHILNNDAVIVGCSWAMQILEENLVSLPIGIVNYGVDRTIFHENVEPLLSFQDATVFINVSKKEIRKGHPELLEAFNKAFEPTDNVILIMCWYNRFYSKEENDRWDKVYKDSKMGQRIYIHPGFAEKQEEIAGLYASADCGVYPSKAEGFGLSPLELMSMGKHVILTNYSGHTEYARHENSLLIDIDEVELAYDGKWFFGQGNWGAFGSRQIDQLVEHMRYIHGVRRCGKLRLNENGLATAKQYSWTQSAKQMVNFLEALS